MHSKSRIAQPMVREGWLKHGPGPSEGRGREPFVPVSWDKALDLVAGEIERVRREHGNAAIMGGSQGWSSAGLFHEARVQLHRFLAAGGRLRRSGDELQLRRGAGVPAAYRRQPAVGGRAADLVVVDRAALQADGAVRRRQPEEHAGEQGRLRVALHPRLDRGIGARRRRGGQHQSDSRRRPGRGSSGVDSDPAEHRYRDAARADAHAWSAKACTTGNSSTSSAPASIACCPI